MKRLHHLFAFLLGIGAVTILMASCKKGNTDEQGGCSIGGFDASATVLFWVSKDYGGGIYQVNVVDDRGNNNGMVYSQISVYNASDPGACNSSDANYSRHAVTYIPYGHTYSYTAISANSSFKGTITVPCDQTHNCISIQIDRQ